MKVISKERSTQSSDELKTLGADGGSKQHSGGNHPTSSYLWQTGSVSQVGPGTQFPFQVWSQATGNGAPDVQSRTLESEENMYSEDESIYIRIPLLETFHNEPTARDHLVPYVTSRYKLINGFPSDNIVNITRSYAMSFDSYTGNAEWVYEILNRNTLVNNCDPISFGQGYDKGHLAAAANHRWCREAYNDTYLLRNIIPQNHLLNIRVWKDLENRCRNMSTDNEIRNVHVYTGPLYIRPMHHFELEGRSKIVPTHLFKVIIVENVNGTVRAPGCYVMPNEAPQTTDLNVYRMNIGEFQRLITGQNK
uniref:Uncharacterized protein n=1 Tax=Sinocyclocheilus anshuiensis TaxID=1608454 RepID=A0A671KJK5_9TELE